MTKQHGAPPIGGTGKVPLDRVHGAAMVGSLFVIRSSKRHHREPRKRPVLARVIATTAAAAVVGVTLSVASSGAATLTPAQAAAAVSGKVTVWGDAAPAGAVDTDRDSVELGTPFTPTNDGIVLGVRFYKTAENTGVHVGNLWDSTGKRLASATFTGETAKGWQTVYFDKPVTLKSGTRYVASYLAPKGRYFQTQQSWAGSTTWWSLTGRSSTSIG